MIVKMILVAQVDAEGNNPFLKRNFKMIALDANDSNKAEIDSYRDNPANTLTECYINTGKES